MEDCNAAVRADPYLRALGDVAGRVARANDARNVKLARHDGRMREDAALVGDNSGAAAQHGMLRRLRHDGDDDIARLDVILLAVVGPDNTRTPRDLARAGDPPLKFPSAQARQSTEGFRRRRTKQQLHYTCVGARARLTPGEREVDALVASRELTAWQQRAVDGECLQVVE